MLGQDRVVIYTGRVLLFLFFCVLFLGSSIVLKKEFDIAFILILIPPLILYHFKFSGQGPVQPFLPKKAAWGLLVYFFWYYFLILKFNILGASIVYWLFQFLIPIAILKFYGCSWDSISFKFENIFKDFRIVIFSCLWLTPFLLYGIQDSEKILPMVATGKFFIYLPLSVLFMVVVVAFWEEFFFRGAIQTSLLSLFDSSFEIPVFLSSLFFGIYHFPFRYLNDKSPFFQDFLGSLASNINEQFLMGIFLGYVVFKSRNVWHGIWLHAFMNGISFIFKMSQMIKFH